MEIKYLGHSCFRIKGKKVILVTDPYGKEVGFEMPRVSAHIITVSHGHFDHNNVAAVQGTSTRKEPFVAEGPGEYEVVGVTIYGFTSFHDSVKGQKRGKNTIYLINLDGIKLAHLGDLGSLLPESSLEELNSPDVLFIPVGGTYTIDPKEAVKVISQLEPKIVIPMHYRVSQSSPSLAKALCPVEDFLKEIGAEETKPVSNLIVTPDKLPEETKVVVLKKTA